MRECKQCNADISSKHKNAVFCRQKCKDSYHNSKTGRIERSRLFANKEKSNAFSKASVSYESSLERLLEQKINHPFAGMTEFGDRG